MISCNHCNSNLVVKHVPQNRTYQCAVCGCPNTIQRSDETGVANRLARISFLFGLVPIALIVLGFLLFRFFDAPWTTGWLGPVSFAVGTIAIFYGLKAVLRSRYEPISSRSRWSAIFGAASGSCLGVMVGGITTLILIAGLFIRLNSYDMSRPAQVTEVMHELASLDKPSAVDWTPAIASLTPLHSRIEFWDNENFVESEHRIYLGWVNALFTSQIGSTRMNRNNLRERLLEKIMGGNYSLVEKTEESELNWEISGQTRPVTKTTWTGEIDKEEEKISLDYITYECLFDAKGNTFCLVLLGKLPALKIKESQVKSTFESFQAK